MDGGEVAARLLDPAAPHLIAKHFVHPCGRDRRLQSDPSTSALFDDLIRGEHVLETSDLFDRKGENGNLTMFAGGQDIKFALYDFVATAEQEYELAHRLRICLEISDIAFEPLVHVAQPDAPDNVTLTPTDGRSQSCLMLEEIAVNARPQLVPIDQHPIRKVPFQGGSSGTFPRPGADHFGTDTRSGLYRCDIDLAEIHVDVVE